MDINDGLPQLLCVQCISQLNQASMFKAQSQQSDLYLRNKIVILKEQLLAELSAKVKIESITVPINEDQVDVPDTNEVIFSCDKCKESFDLENDLKIHQLSHSISNNFRCEVCKKYCSNARSLRRHIKTHLKNKPFNCNLCERSFSEASSYEKHKRRHSEDKRHLCNVCGKRFYEANVLAVHIRTHTG